jgi:hypothetical protein
MQTIEMTDEELAQFRQWQQQEVPSVDRGVHVTFLLDRSGSMESIRDDVIGGFNSFVAEQASQPGRCSLTLWTFDTHGFDRVHDKLDIGDVPAMTRETFVPRAGTPLYDAVGRTISSMGASSDNQVLVIFTDGQENSSREWRREQVVELIKAKEAAGWTIVFLGVGIDAYAEGGSIHVNAGSTQSVAPDSVGVASAMASTSSAVSNYRGKTYRGATPDSADFFETGKEADEDLRRRRSTPLP